MILLLKILSHLCISMYKAHVFFKEAHEDLCVHDIIDCRNYHFTLSSS